MKKINCLFTSSLLLTSVAFAAQDIQLHGTQSYVISLPSNTMLAKSKPVKSIRLLNVTLSDKAWQSLQQQSSDTTAKAMLKAPAYLPKKVQLGMNRVPVLDQGLYGTCVTFAVTAAIDAALDQGDHISQVCQLTLGQYLENNSYAISGWNGSFGANVLSQMETYGYISKDDEHTLGCGGLYEYPQNGKIPQATMNIEEFHALSHDIADEKNAIHWSNVLDSYQTFTLESDRNRLLDTVKKALYDGDRLTFGILLLLPDVGVAGATGAHHVANDTWVLMPAMYTAIKARGLIGGHEMIITGYDDNAEAIDSFGFKHKGLLTLRNSWGDEVGDNGNFYMTYDYFKLLTTNVERIRRMHAAA